MEVTKYTIEATMISGAKHTIKLDNQFAGPAETMITHISGKSPVALRDVTGVYVVAPNIQSFTVTKAP